MTGLRACVSRTGPPPAGSRGRSETCPYPAQMGRQLGQDRGRSHRPEHPDLEVELEHRVHAADVAFEHHYFDQGGEHQPEPDHAHQELAARVRAGTEQQQGGENRQRERQPYHGVDQQGGQHQHKGNPAGRSRQSLHLGGMGEMLGQIPQPPEPAPMSQGEAEGTYQRVVAAALQHFGDKVGDEHEQEEAVDDEIVLEPGARASPQAGAEIGAGVVVVEGNEKQPAEDDDQPEAPGQRPEAGQVHAPAACVFAAGEGGRDQGGVGGEVPGVHRPERADGQGEQRQGEDFGRVAPPGGDSHS